MANNRKQDEDVEEGTPQSVPFQDDDSIMLTKLDNGVENIKAGEEEMVDYDEAVKLYGTGRYQLFIFTLLVFITFSTVFNNNGYIFIAANMGTTCQVPDLNNVTMEDNTTLVETYVADECTYYSVLSSPNGSVIRTGSPVECDSWEYDRSLFKSTIVSEWNLNNCSGKWLIALANSLFMLGFFLGCIVLGDLTDRFGRNKLLVLSSGLMTVSGVAAAYSVNIEMLIVMRFVLGIFTAGARNAAFVYVCEITHHRASAGMIHGSVYSLGGVIVTAIAQFLPNWRHFQLACAISYLVFIPYYWILPESPRWMLSQRNTKAAVKYFKKSAKINKVKIPENFSVHLQAQVMSQGTVLTLFKTTNLRKKSLIVCVLWFCVSTVFFGMNYNVGNLTGNIFTNNYLLQGTGILEFVGIWYLMLGRRPAISSAFLIAALLSGLLPIFSIMGVKVGTVVLAMVGKLLIETNFEMIYIATSEIYPTTARVTALGLGSSLARIGGAISPYIVLTHDAWPNMPYVIFSALALVAGLLAVLLPETRGRKLPDSVAEAENENGLSNFCCCKKDEDKTKLELTLDPTEDTKTSEDTDSSSST